ncbi:MAG: hypothetical protein ACXW32_08525 [Limisphaerales bacterium]
MQRFICLVPLIQQERAGADWKIRLVRDELHRRHGERGIAVSEGEVVICGELIDDWAEYGREFLAAEVLRLIIDLSLGGTGGTIPSSSGVNGISLPSEVLFSHAHLSGVAEIRAGKWGNGKVSEEFFYRINTINGD